MELGKYILAERIERQTRPIIPFYVRNVYLLLIMEIINVEVNTYDEKENAF